MRALNRPQHSLFLEMEQLDLDLSWIHDAVPRPEHIPYGVYPSQEASLKAADHWPSVLLVETYYVTVL